MTQTSIQPAPIAEATQRRTTEPLPALMTRTMKKQRRFPEERRVSLEGNGIVNAGTEENKSPVVGWLVCTAGTHIGEDFRLTAGNNTIGRSGTMDVCLSGENTVSRGKHAVVVYEPEENIFLTTPGDVKELSYLNGRVVLAPQVLKRGDRIRLGEVELMFIPCCGEDFTWKK